MCPEKGKKLGKGLEYKFIGGVQSGGKEVQGPSFSLPSQRGGCSGVMVRLFPHAISNRTRRKIPKLHRGRFRLDIRENLSLDGLPNTGRGCP